MGNEVEVGIEVGLGDVFRFGGKTNRCREAVSRGKAGSPAASLGSRKTSGRSLSPLLLLGTIVLTVSQAGCAVSPAVRAARSGDWDGLRSVLSADRARHKLDAATVQKLAGTVARREIAKAQGDDGVARIEDVKACGLQLRDALDDRAKHRNDGDDSVAAAATLALLDGGPRVARAVDRKDLTGRAATATSPLWRAAAARASQTPERIRYFTDPDERVRLAALRGALEKPSEEERDALFEVARLDPNPLAQSLAMRALGTLGGERVVLALVDLYARADSELRVSIVDAWATPACVKAGSTRHLVSVAQSQSGIASVSAATALLGRNDEANAAIGLETLLRAANEGASMERVLAIGRLPISAEAKAEARTAEAGTAKARTAEAGRAVANAGETKTEEAPPERRRKASAAQPEQPDAEPRKTDAAVPAQPNAEPPETGGAVETEQASSEPHEKGEGKAAQPNAGPPKTDKRVDQKSGERKPFAGKSAKVLIAIEKAAASEDKAVRIAALVRMVELPTLRERATQELRALSHQGSRAALLALAQIGDRTALDPLRHEMTSASPESRLSLGRTLMGLGGTAEAADLLADRDAHVRTSAACSILLRSGE